MGERYVRRRMKELGIPENQIGQPDYDGDGQWRAFDAKGRKGGANTTGSVVDSGVLNPDLLKGQKGCRIWRKMRLKFGLPLESILGDVVNAVLAASKGVTNDH